MNAALTLRNWKSLAEDLPDLLAPQYRQSGAGGPPQVYGGPSGGPPSGGPPRPSAPQPRKSELPIGIIAAVVVVVVVIAWSCWALSPHPASIPTAYMKFSSPDNIFSVDGPNGWTRKLAQKYDNATDAADDQARGGLQYTSGSGLIDITQDRTSTLTANELLNSSGPVPSSMSGSSSQADELNKKTEIRNVKGYTEIATTSVANPLGDVVVTEWIATGPTIGFPYKIHGYKASATAASYTLSVICQSPDSQWAQLKPVFDHVIGSFMPGSRVVNELNAPQPGGVH